MKSSRVKLGLQKRREIYQALVTRANDGGRSIRRPGSMNGHKTSGVPTNGGKYQKSGRNRPGGSARNRSRAALKARG